MMKTWKFLIYLIPATLLLTSCSGKATEETAGQEVQEAGKNTEAAFERRRRRRKRDQGTGDPALCRRIPESLSGRDQPKRRKARLQRRLLCPQCDRLSYEDDSNYTYRLGVDVSEHQAPSTGSR